MPTDVRTLLRDAAALPSAPLDVEAAMQRGRRLRRRRVLVQTGALVLVLGLLGTGVWSVTGRGSVHRLNTTNTPHPRAPTFSVTIPSGWQRATPVLTPGLTDPHEILAVGTFPMPVATVYGPACDNQLPAVVVNAMRPDDAFVWLLESDQLNLQGFSARPTNLGDGSVLRPDALCRLPAAHGQRLYWGAFQDAGRGFYAAVLVGPNGSATRLNEAWMILNSLRFARTTSAATLAWIDTSQGLMLAEPATGQSRVVGPPGLWCWACPFIRVGPDLYTAQDPFIYRLEPTARRLEPVGPGQHVMASTFIGEMYVETAQRQVELRTVTGQRVAGPWSIPAGYTITDTPHAVTNGVLLATDENDRQHRLVAWDPPTGRLRPLGSVWKIIDTTLPSGRAPSTIASVDCSAPPSHMCPLLFTNSATGRTRRIDAPNTNGFVGGGAFSPDGTQLAAFVSSRRGGGNAELAIIDVATGHTKVIGNSAVGLGEPFGYAVWAPKGDWIVFGGLRGPMHTYRLGDPQASALPFDTNYSVVTLPSN